MENIKLGDLYLSKEESRDIIEFLTKKRNIKNIKVNRAIDYIKFLKNNLKLKKE